MNGEFAAATALAEAIAAGTGRRAEVAIHTGLHTLVDLVPHVAPGRFREARGADLALIDEWLQRFAIEADEQAGRSGGHTPHLLTGPELRQRLDQHQFWIWEDLDCTPVSFAGRSEDIFGWVRIGPVFTPQQHRRRGYAGHRSRGCVHRSAIKARRPASTPTRRTRCRTRFTGGSGFARRVTAPRPGSGDPPRLIGR